MTISMHLLRDRDTIFVASVMTRTMLESSLNDGNARTDRLELRKLFRVLKLNPSLWENLRNSLKIGFFYLTKSL